MTAFGNIPGDGRDRPPGGPRPEPGKDDLSHLDIAKGTRVRVIADDERRGLKGLEGVVVQSMPGAVIVELENDPLLYHRSNMRVGFEKAKRQPQRHLRVIDVERV